MNSFNISKNKKKLKQLLNQKIEYQHLLYRRGYIVTTKQDLTLESYPFYGNWNKYKINNRYCAYIHKDQNIFIKHSQSGDRTILLIGNAYNPFSEEISENELLKSALSKLASSEEEFFNYISEWTGIFVVGLFYKDRVLFVQDCTAMEACFYGLCEGQTYFLSHVGILGDISCPTENKFISSLIKSYSYNHWGTKYLPGDLTVFNEMRRLGPNVSVCLRNRKFHIQRFYPLSAHQEVDAGNKKILEEIASIIRKSVYLCADKWERPAISLSGGLDSRTTFAAANGRYDSFYYYSFHCKEQEKQDAYAAHEICSTIGVPHTIYPITDNNDDIQDFELFKTIVAHNEAYTHIPPDHEIRKYYFLSSLNDFDVELKSWASEIGRAYWEKRYGFSLPLKLTPRDFSIFQTRFLGTPLLMRKSENAYRNYLKKTKLLDPPFNYEHTDMFYWEYRFGSNGTTVTMEQQIFNFDVTMPMNNRKLMDMFLWYPHDFRKLDGVNIGAILINEPRFANIHHDVHNGYFKGKRVMLEGLYYKYRKMFDFSRRDL